MVVIDTEHVAVHPIRVVRVIRGWTQQELERRAGLPTTVLSRIERGRRIPDPATQLRIAMALDTSPEDLFRNAA